MPSRSLKKRKRRSQFKSRRNAQSRNRTRRYKRRRPNTSITYGNAKRAMTYRRKRFGTPYSRYFKQAVRKVVDGNNTMTFREVASGASLSGINQHNYVEWSILDRDAVQDALQQNRQLVPDVATGEAKIRPAAYGYGLQAGQELSADNTLAVKWKVLRTLFSVKFRNNSTGPAECTFYQIRPKKDHAVTTSPITEITNGLVSTGLDAATINDIRYTPYDSSLFNQYFTVYKKVVKTLQPGDEHTVTFSGGSFTYDTDLAKYHTTTYNQKKFQKWLLVKHKGVIGTDEVTNEVGRCESALSWEFNTSIKYSATGDQEFHRHTNGEYLPTLQNAPVCAHKPAPSIQFPTSKADYDQNNANMPIPITNPLGLASTNAADSKLTSVNTKLSTSNVLLNQIKNNTA